MARDGVASRAPFWMSRIRPGCSTTKTRLGSSRGAVTCTGWTSPEATRTEASAVPATVGTPAQRAEEFSSWQVAEQPSPLFVLPSSHSSVPSAIPLPQTGALQPWALMEGGSVRAILSRTRKRTHKRIEPPSSGGNRPSARSVITGGDVGGKSRGALGRRAASEADLLAPPPGTSGKCERGCARGPRDQPPQGLVVLVVLDVVVVVLG